MADVHVPSLLDDEEISVSNLFDDEIEEACAELREENAAQAARIKELEEQVRWERNKRECAEARGEKLEAELAESSKGGWMIACVHAVERAEAAEARCEKVVEQTRELEEFRKRWEIGFRNIVSRTIGPSAPFEINQVVNLVEAAWKQRDALRAAGE